MAYLGNSPGQATILRVEARKSFALGVQLRDPKGRPVDLTGCQLTIVAKATPVDVDSDDSNLLAADAVAAIADPAAGFGQFNIQAASLDHPAGEYPYAIVLRTADGYSSVIVKGVLDIQQNTEFASVLSSYSAANTPQSLTAHLRGANSINVFVGGQLPPGMNYVRDDIMEAIESFDPGAVAMVPPGGTAGYALVKVGAADYQMDWRPRENGPFGLDATDQPAGAVPTAQGDDTWTWDEVGIDATGVPAGLSPVTDGLDSWEWGDVTTPPADWEAGEGSPGEILNKPTLGTAAAQDVEAFLAADALVSQMEGIHFRTSVPTSGEDGHLYLVYEE